MRNTFLFQRRLPTDSQKVEDFKVRKFIETEGIRDIKCSLKSQVFPLYFNVHTE